MNKLYLDNIKKAHFIGIGGISMSGLAEILNFRGILVTGSDVNETEITNHLREKGISVVIGQRGENIPADCELVIYTAAVKEDNPELVAAQQMGVHVIDRAELLGCIMGLYKNSVGVAGTHGKTTTTSMVSEAMIHAGLDPTLNIGGIFTAIGANFRIGESDYFVAESCEYFDSFVKFYPRVGIILNIEYDHTDYFKTMDQLENSFKRFAGNISVDGLLVINSEIDNLEKIISGLQCRVVTYGKNGDYHAENIEYAADGKPAFDVFYKGELKTRTSLNISGLHNIENALAAFACCDFFGMESEVCAESLESFVGAKRRFEIKGSFGGVTVIDDYAHHPTEVAATLAAAKKHKHNKLFCAFQPHTYSRTKAFLDRFAGSFADADVVVILDIYSARENFDETIHSKDLAERIGNLGKEVHYFDSFSAAKIFLVSQCAEGDMLMTMGAGDINKLGEDILFTELSTLSTDEK